MRYVIDLLRSRGDKLNAVAPSVNAACAVQARADPGEHTIRVRGSDQRDPRRQAVGTERAGHRDCRQIEEIDEIRVIAELAVPLDGCRGNLISV